ncbi:uncharacterized protein LOC118751757 [Rhagoletis pomonella]|uniref:uncharacterized protein LOC118751757 n=1 Tax=Rhagoletis pomonella TaxID=28610 RepID=UPI001781DAA0|nr:uncharacterized protein LOC118751757 [Rhagoletis pomonella]
MAGEHEWISTNIETDLPPFAVQAGHDSDGDAIFVGRAYHKGDVVVAKVVPNKQQAYVAWGGEEVNKHDIEVLAGHNYHWVPDANGSVPPGAVSCGLTSLGEPLYVGRGYHANSLTPGKIHPSQGCLYIGFGGEEVTVTNYEVLVRSATISVEPGAVINYENTWVHSSPYQPVPPFAVIGGHDSDGTPIYVGRSFHEGDNLPAKVVPSKGAGYVCWGGREITKSHYEILVGQGYAWVPCYGGSVPPNAVRTGTTRTGEPLYVGRGHHANSLTVGKIHPSHGCLYIPFGGQEVRIATYEVLIKQSTDQWVPSTPNYAPPSAVVAGYDTDRAPIYVARAMHEGYKWVHSSAYASLPPNALLGGNDFDGDTIYVGRTFHNGDTLVAKIVPKKHIAFVSWRGEAFPKDHFEVLCGTNLSWRQCYDHVVPENAVLCGKTALGQPVYIGRGHYEGSLSVGKISSVHRALFIPFKNAERRLESYEILVEDKHTEGWAIDETPPPPLEEKKPTFPTPPTEDMKPYPPPLDVKPPFGTPMPIPLPAPMGPPPPNDPYNPYAPPAPTHFDPPPSYQSLGVSVYPTIPPMHSPMPPPRPQQSDTWVVSSANYTPPNAVHAGHDTDLSPILVCRCFHNGDFLPGKAIPSRACAYVSYAGQEIPKSDFEILIGEGYDWVPASDGIIPPGAIEAGRTADGEPLYVGRAHYCGSLTPGKIQPSHRALYIAFGGYERRIPNYEVLVRRNDFYRDEAVKICY